MDKVQENGEKFNLSLRVSGVRRDMQHKFTRRGFEEEDDEIELSLGLSSNGRFGVDPARKKLKRYSSISDLVSPVEAASDNLGDTQQPRVAALESYGLPLMRTCSLPSEEVRHRRELQSMRRMEARKKRSEKLKNARVVKDKESCLESENGDFQRVCNGNCNGLENGHGMEGSIGSPGSGSSGVSETLSPHINGKQNAEVKSPSSIQSSPAGQMEHKPGDKGTTDGAKEKLKNVMLDMPYVSTKWDGINGNKVDGFLYGYKKGEEVRILCVCHGLFLSPAEFVKHGGGGDVENPLKHIVVNPSPLL
ncbi:ninja-family protein AFP3-like [Primulina huaijiensis]|uniref:ninja-family protein AFP3-like n=1 Tax=Primulina huaijiensis TaxID=1492673 RepID=UPI003CC6E440